MLSRPPKRGDHDWVDTVTEIARALGLNPVRVRWKLEALRSKTRAAAFRAGETADHVRYEHKICAGCGRLNDGEATECVRCGAPLGGKGWHRLHRLGVAVPSVLGVTSLLGTAMVVVYGRLLLATGDGDGIVSLDVAALLHHGGNWAPATLGGLELWRLGTAIFLHAGIWHIGFNLIALSQVGPPIEELFGRGRMLVFFMVTGLLASLGSALAGGAWAHALTGSLGGLGGGVSIGASGAVMGLIGVAAGWGQRDGTTLGRNVRNRMLRWVLLVLVFGFFIGADNVAHVVGLIAGGIIGLVTPPAALQRSRRVPVIVAQVGLGGVAALASVVLCLLPPASPADRMMSRLLGMTRGESLVEDELERACAALEEGTLDALPWYDVPAFPTFGLTTEQRRASLSLACDDLRRQQLCEDFRLRGVVAVLEAGQRLAPSFEPDDESLHRLEAIYRQRCGVGAPPAPTAPHGAPPSGS